jgi:6-phosphogluconolactonase (cycloisomerase 2 family)
MKSAKLGFVFVALLAVSLTLMSCGGGAPCPAGGSGSTGGSGSGGSGGVPSNSPCALPSGGGSGGSGGTGTTVAAGSSFALLYAVSGSSIEAAGLTNQGVFGNLNPFTSPTLAGSGTDNMLIVSKKFVYIPQSSTTNIEGFTINRSSGALALIPGTPVTLSFPADTIASDPQGRFLFIGNESGGDIASFKIDPVTGALTPAPNSPINVVGISSADVFTVDGAGKYLYVGEQSTSSSALVHGFSIDQTTGALTAVPGSPFALGVATLHTDPSGRYLLGVRGYVDLGGTSNDNNIYVFSIDSTTGFPSPVSGSPFAMAASANEFVIHPTGKFVFTMDVDASGSPTAMEGFQMDPTTGILTALTGSPFTALPGAAQCFFEQSGVAMFCADTYFGGNFEVFNVDPNSGAVTHSVANLGVGNNIPFAVTD